MMNSASALHGQTFPFDSTWLLTVFLMSIRLAAVLVMTPILYAFPVPATVRVLFVIALAVMFTLAFPSVRMSAEPNVAQLFVSAFGELILGATLGLGILLAFSAFSVAGNLLDVQIGYGLAQVFDPVSHRQMPILTGIFNQIAAIVFFAMNGHYALMRGLAYSVEHFPPGRGWHIQNAAGPVFKQLAGLFSLGFALVAPVVFCVMLVELGLGILARNLPQMNMFAMGIPVKVLVGLTVLSIWLCDAGGVMASIYMSIFQTWQGIFGSLS
jgi:flagellar biosynthetic protein FliR